MQVASLKTIPDQVVQMRRKLKFDDTQVPVSPGNQRDVNTDDPSNLGKLQLVTPHFPIGNGHGPQIEKKGAELSKGLAAVYDADKYRTSGSLVRKPLAGLPESMSSWQGNDPSFPFMPFSPFQTGRFVRSSLDKAQLPKWMTATQASQTGAGAVAGAGLGLGISGVQHLLAPHTAVQPGSAAAIGGLIGSLLGFLRKPQGGAL